MFFVNVILPLPLPRTFTYSAPDELAAQIQKGVRVIVPFGVRKFYSAIVLEIHDSHSAELIRSAEFAIPPPYIKEIVSVLDRHPVVNDLQIRLWQWIASAVFAGHSPQDVCLIRIQFP